MRTSCFVRPEAVGVLLATLLVGCSAPVSTEPPDTKPSFGGQTVPDQTYTVGAPIALLVLPAATGGNPPLSYSLTPTVPGLRFAAASRTLQGTPSSAGTHSITYRVVDADGDAATLRFEVRVAPAPVADTKPSFGGQTVPDQTYTVDAPIAPLVLPAATGGNPPLSYSLTPTVPGLRFAAASRTLQGTPSSAGTHSMTYRVVDADGDAATLRFEVRVAPAPVADTKPSFGGQTVPDQTYTVGAPIALLVLPAATGGNPPLSYSLTPTVPGLRFAAASRTLQGTPSSVGTHSMTYRVVDADGDAATLRFEVRVAPVPEPDDGSWVTWETTNPLDDTTTVVAFLRAVEGVGGYSSDPFLLVARCKSDKTEVYIDWHDYLGDDTKNKKRVTYRFPPSDAVTELWGVSTDNEATFVARAIPFLRTLVQSDRLVAQTTPYGESPSLAVFDLAGAPVAIARVAEECHWEF